MKPAAVLAFKLVFRSLMSCAISFVCDIAIGIVVKAADVHNAIAIAIVVKVDADEPVDQQLGQPTCLCRMSVFQQQHGQPT